MAEVELIGVEKRFAATAVIAGLSLEVRDGELMVLVGPSGCGKSTVLRMIAGLEAASGGEIRIGGRRVDGLPPKDRDVAMVFQSYALYPHMTVRQNLEFGPRVRKMPSAEAAQRVDDAVEILGIRALLDRRPAELSGGERQRVALGRAIVRKPSVFLFDEPLSNLDAKLRVQLRAEISRLQRELGTTAIYVTHDQVEAMTMGRRIAVLHRGRLQQVDEPLAVYERPANLFVAGFIGAPPMNLFPARSDPVRGRLLAGGFELPLPERWRRGETGAVSAEVMVGIRPESLVRDPPEERGGALELEVQMVEPLGSEIFVHGRCGEVPMVARLAPERPPAVGERVRFAVRDEAIHLFDRERGERWREDAA